MCLCWAIVHLRPSVHLPHQTVLPSSLPMDTLRKCDIVIQGGVTSGIVYPGLVCKLAEYYQFQQIGGTSAGAIAAALTAAAEYSRRKGKANAFEDVAKVSTWLGESDFGKILTCFPYFSLSPK
jgi:predicted acylesterase/phospholipase RssA